MSNSNNLNKFELSSSHARVTSIKFTKQQWVSQWVSDKSKQWSDSGPITRLYKTKRFLCSSKDDCDKCSLRVCADVTYCTTDTQVSRLRQFVSSVLLGCSTSRYTDSHLFNILQPRQTSHHCRTQVYTCQAHPKSVPILTENWKRRIALHRHMLNDDISLYIVIWIAVKHTRIWPSSRQAVCSAHLACCFFILMLSFF